MTCHPHVVVASENVKNVRWGRTETGADGLLLTDRSRPRLALRGIRAGWKLLRGRETLRIEHRFLLSASRFMSGLFPESLRVGACVRCVWAVVSKYAPDNRAEN